jgi:large subunit ribosomal protein L10
MPTEAKSETIAELREEIAGARTMIVSEYRGLKVKEIAEIRRALRKQDVSYRVVKNRLMRIAAEDSVGEALSPLLVGPTALTFVGEDSVAAAKALRDTARTNPLLVLKGGSLGTNVLTAADITALADLPSREELLAQFAGALQAPLVKTANLLQALPRNMAYGLSALIDLRSADTADAAA